jgi:hypothetical protein
MLLEPEEDPPTPPPELRHQYQRDLDIAVERLKTPPPRDRSLATVVNGKIGGAP